MPRFTTDPWLAEVSAKMVEYLKTEGYTNLRVLDDGTITGLQKLMYTTALYIGLNQDGWERRYCYEDPVRAFNALVLLEDGDQEPMEGYVAKRGR